MSSIYDMLANLHVNYSKELNISIKAIQDSISKINREDDNTLFINQNELYFKKPEPFVFEPYGTDSVNIMIL